MDAILQRIKSYAKILNSTIEDGDYLDFIVANVVDRALNYTNRTQLVDGYLYILFHAGYTSAEILENTNYEGQVFGHDCPIPPQMERILATVVSNTYTDIQENTREIKSMNDNGQSVTFGSDTATTLATATDREIFLGVTEQLDNFRMISVIEDTTRLYKSY